MALLISPLIRFARRKMLCSLVSFSILCSPSLMYSQEEPPQQGSQKVDSLGSPYIPVDSWIYPAAMRLYSLGYLDGVFLNMRPWTRRSLLHSLEKNEALIRVSDNDEAKDIWTKLAHELQQDRAITERGEALHGIQSLYGGFRQISGQPLRDSFHVGQTFYNDYGRPYSSGFNSDDGFSGLEEKGRFSLYVRGEYQHAPKYQGYSSSVAEYLSRLDGINPYGGFDRPQSTIPEGVLPAQNNFRLLEANLSGHLLGHEISFGKSDAWLGPGLGGSMAWSNNAENMYSFRINRVEPLHIPYVSNLLGPLRYDFFLGSLKGHTSPNSPWAHSEMFAFAPTKNFQFGFQRTVIFGGAGHAPVTLHSFLKSFFDINDTTGAEKLSRNDPGARFSSFNFSWRLPYVRDYLTLYADSTTHDDVTPPSAPRRAGWRSGLYISRIPKVPKLDLRVEGVYTDYPTSRSNTGRGNYWEAIQKQGYTNKGFLFGDWVGREAKGGQAWLTYHISGNESASLQYLHKKNPKDFIPLGTTQNAIQFNVTKRIKPDIEVQALVQYEQWKAPFIAPKSQSNTSGSLQITWYPKLLMTR